MSKSIGYSKLPIVIECRCEWWSVNVNPAKNVPLPNTLSSRERLQCPVTQNRIISRKRMKNAHYLRLLLTAKVILEWRETVFYEEISPEISFSKVNKVLCMSYHRLCSCCLVVRTASAALQSEQPVIKCNQKPNTLLLLALGIFCRE